MYDCEKRKGIHSLAQCVGDFFRRTGLLMVVRRNRPLVTPQSICWFLSTGGEGGTVSLYQ